MPQPQQTPPALKARPVPTARGRLVPAGLLGHVLPEGAFDALSAGPGDKAAVTALLETRSSVIRALVAKVASGLDGGGGDLGRAAAEGLALLARLDTEQPAAVREIFAYPFTQAWATRCLRPPMGADLDLDRAHLAGLAAAAALRAGVAAELTLPVRDGSLYLPMIGALAVDTRASRTAVVRLSRRGISSERRVARVAGCPACFRGRPVGHGRGHRPIPRLLRMAGGRAPARRDVARLAAGSGRRRAVPGAGAARIRGRCRHGPALGGAAPPGSGGPVSQRDGAAGVRCRGIDAAARHRDAECAAHPRDAAREAGSAG